MTGHTVNDFDLDFQICVYLASHVESQELQKNQKNIVTWDSVNEMTEIST